MTNSRLHEESQLLARVTVLERVVGMMVRESMLGTGQDPRHILAYGESIKKFFEGRTPMGATEDEINAAADRFFSEIASDIGSQDSHQ
ncbi:hypothetical protein [Hyphomicrobium sp. 2TAF46]|uniref:hypothetical protein n=1 Tax=Hyphomicrobium sp. 2TAF46 TaxID=3233019 RepID=UPI003F92E88A